MLFRILVLLVFIAGCSSRHQSELTVERKVPPVLQRRISDPADSSLKQIDVSEIEELAPQLLEQARQHYIDALEAEENGDTSRSAAEFEFAISILSDLSYYPTIDSSQEFNDLSRSIIEDYEKYISSIDDLDSTASVFAFREKMNQILESAEPDNEESIRNVITSTVIPLAINGYVERAITYFQNKGREVFERYLYRAGRYFPVMRRIFAEENLPEELVYLSMVESGVNPNARSWARAVGMWQFIKGTGMLYGLRGNWWYDERRNVEKSTHAAARHLRDLHEEFGDWYLAMAAYNSGMGRVYRAIRRSGSTDFWKIRRYLPRETRNYVPLFLATTVIGMNPREYGFEITPAGELSYNLVTIDECVDLTILAECAETDVETLRELNPELLQWSTPPGYKGYQLRIPEGKQEVFTQNYVNVPEEKKRDWIVHVVKRGEVLGKIGRRYGISVDLLMETNHLKSTRTLSVGRNLLIPVPSSALKSRVRYASSAYNQGTGGDRGRRSPVVGGTRKRRLPNVTDKTRIVHIVKKGDALGQLAQQYGVRLSDLRNWNDISYKSRIFVGETLFVWVSTDTIGQKATAPEGWMTYRVKEGDALEKIALEHNVAIGDITRWNGLRSDVIRSGEDLSIQVEENPQNNGESVQSTPESRKFILYKIKKGDSLYRIAASFGTSVEELKSWNNLRSNRIRVGEELKIYSEVLPVQPTNEPTFLPLKGG